MTGEDGSPAPFKVWMDVAESEKLILIYPEGLLRQNGETGWNDCRGDATSLSTADDVTFINDLIQQFHSSFTIDPERIYASGVSNGGFMSLRLALEISDQIAAVGVISAGMPAISKCADAVRPTSILFMNGTADPLVPFLGGTIGDLADGRGSVQSVPDSVQYWTDFNQTLQVAPVSDFSDTDITDGSTVRRYRYFDGLEQTGVVLYEINGGGHSGPSILEQYPPLTELVIGKQNHDIEMAREVWEFFKDKRLQ
jgi:polyhydroxybutyrate depolymerase